MVNHIARSDKDTWCGDGEIAALHCSTSPGLASCHECVVEYIDELEAKAARVEALADGLDKYRGIDWIQRDIRKALEGDSDD